MTDDIQSSTKKQGNNERWKSVISVIAVLAIAYVAFKMLLGFLVPIVVGILLIANRDLVGKAIKFIYQQYKDETYKGLIATVAAIVLFSPFVIFLFARSVYYMFIDSPQKTKIEDNSTSTLINMAVKKKVKNFLEDDNKA